MQLELISTGIGIIVTLIGLGWKFGTYLGEIKTSVVRIETLLQMTSARIDRIEIEVDEIKKELHK